MSLYFLIPIHWNEMHHFPHILPTLLLLSNMTKPTNRSIGLYQSCLTNNYYRRRHWFITKGYGFLNRLTAIRVPVG